MEASDRSFTTLPPALEQSPEAESPFRDEGEAGSGQICINGAAAHLIQPGDIAINIAYAQMDETEARTFVPRVVFVDHDNRMVDIGDDPALIPDGFGFEASGTPRGQN